MRTRNTWIAVAIIVSGYGSANAQDAGGASPTTEAILVRDANKALASLTARLKERLTNALPPQWVIDKEYNWGHQAHVSSLQGLTPVQVLRNHGNWQKAKVVVVEVPKGIKVAIFALATPAEDRVTLGVRVSFPARLELEQQIWQNGILVYSDHVRSRFQLSGALEVEAEMLPVKDGTPATEGVRWRLARGRYACEQFVAENVGGLGGDVARLLDSGAGRSFKPWQPAILDEFQNRVAPIVGAAGRESVVRSKLPALFQYANSAHASYAWARGAMPLPEREPTPGYICLAGSLDEFDASGAVRHAAAHLGRLAHPALADFAIHVVHAALVAATHIHPHGK